MRTPTTIAALAAAAAVATAGFSPPGATTTAPTLQDQASRPAAVAGPARPSELWGGIFTTPSGTTVRLSATAAYATRGNAWLQEWANWIDAHLFHAAELSAAQVVFATPSEVEAICGERTAGCYSGADARIVAPGEDLPTGLLAKSVLAHEYGHHVAAHRDNPPWAAVAYGPKRWATYEHVCERTVAGQAFPGDEGSHYAQNPGEAWAQTYATASQSLLVPLDPTWPSPGAWSYDVMFYPSPQSLQLARVDATSPWARGRSTQWSGRLTKQHRHAARTIATPHDGTLTLSARPASLLLTLRDATNRALLGRWGSTVTFTVCGSRRIEVTAAGASGRYTITATTP